MKEIKFRIRDEEHPALLKKKGKKSWKALFFSALGIKIENPMTQKKK